MIASQFSSQADIPENHGKIKKVTKKILLRECDQISNKLQQCCQIVITFSTITNFLFLSYFYVFLKIELRTLNTKILIADLLIETQ